MNAIGIDLGTTNSVVVHLDRQGVPGTIPNAEGELTTPSVVLYEAEGEIIVGREAKRAATALPEGVADCPKRSMGEEHYPRTIHGKRLSPIDIGAEILRKLKADTEQRIGEVSGAVITVPAYFDEHRRRATTEAAKLAGLTVIDIINEPTSAAIAYAYQHFLDEGGDASNLAALQGALGRTRNVVVYDLGGGTFDVSVVHIDGTHIKVLATEGDVRLGGRDWDEKLINHIADQFFEKFSADPREDPLSSQNLIATAEELKKDLSARGATRFAVNHAGQALTESFTRKHFERLTQPLLFRTERRLKKVVEEAGLTWDDIDKVLLVGGSTRMPQVAKMIEKVSGKPPDKSLSPDEAVARGAAIHAVVQLIQTDDVPSPEVAAARSAVRNRYDEHLQKLFYDISTSNVNSHSLGITAVRDGDEDGVSVLIPRNTPLPVSVTRTFGTSKDNQRRVTATIVEGESPRASECLPLGKCTISDLPPTLKRGSPVEITFHYGNNGLLEIYAVEKSQGTKASVFIDRRLGSS